MSLDAIVSAAMLLGALFLMMRFGCGAHMGAAHTRKMPDHARSRGGGVPTTHTEKQR